MNRGRILESWRKKRSAGMPLRGGVDGPDFLVTSSAGVAGLMPLADANARSIQKTREQAAVAGGAPVVAGVCATDPLRMMETFLQEIKAAGAVGVQNSPSVGLIDGTFRRTLEDSRLGYGREVEMIGLAGKLDLVTVALAFSPEEARKMAEAGADAIVAHPGVAERKAKAIAEIAAAAREARKGILVLAYGAEADGVDGIQIE
ncbi:MAG: phosphoenolpyruvate hydrolase family protein [Planctomycetaceae bacterium]|nr:phosphoenolpyruvate hydrolase family protein [Planctomycetaceae bacterium]